ncbi:methyltransferase domain-containing protein [Raineya sp.]
MNGVTKKRLVVVPGISHLLEVVALLKQETLENEKFEDYLILAQFCVYNNPTKLSIFEKTCTEIANIIHNWHSVIQLNDEEDFIKLPTQEAISYILSKTKIKQAHKIYIVRNFQATNELLLKTYPDADVCIYGDLGYFDSNIPEQVAHKYQISLSVPIEFKPIPPYKTFSLIDKKNIAHNHLQVEEYVNKKLQKYLEIKKKSNQNNILILTNNHTESGLISSLELEIQYYLDVLSKYISSETVVYIKAHPRQTLNQSYLLSEKLEKELGIGSVVFDEDISVIPSELVIKILDFKSVITLASGTYLYIKYLHNITTEQGIDEYIIRKYFRRIYQNYMTYAVEIMKKLYENVNEIADNKTLLKFEKSNMVQVPNPIISNGEVSLVKTIENSTIINLYHKIFNLSVNTYFKETETFILKCNTTGYRFLYPFDIAGDGSFYEFLQQYDWYYMPWKWEHQKVRDRINELGDELKILEIGCAKGSFIERLSQEGYKCVGLELNKKAKQEAQERELNVLAETIQEHSLKFENYYDIVCSFQVMEHIPNIGEVLEASVKSLKKGGSLFISVPNNASFLGLDENNPLNMPPHHMGLWDETALKNIAPFFGLEVKSIYLEPLQEYHKSYFNSIINNLLYEQYKYYREKYGIIGRLYFKFFKYKVRKRIYRAMPQIENFTIIAEYIKL